METPHDEAHQLRLLSRRITAALIVVAVVAMTFTAVSVTVFALDHGVSPWVAWTLDPMVAVALLAVLLADARLVELGTAPSGWATALRWFAGLATWTMNAWSSIWPHGGFGVPRDIDPAGVVLHSVAPVLLVLLAEAATGYRRVIAARIRLLEGAVDYAPAAPAPANAQPPVHTPAAAPVDALAPETLDGPAFDEWDAPQPDAPAPGPDAPWLAPWDHDDVDLEVWARDALAHIPDDPRDAQSDAHPPQVSSTYALHTDAVAGTSRMRRVEAAPDADTRDADLIEQARALDTASLAATGRPASLRKMQDELRIGQARAQRLRRALDTHPAALPAHSHS